MRRSLLAASGLGLLLASITATAVLAHEGSGEGEILVEPSTVKAGETVVLAGSGLEPNDERVIVLVGEHDTIHLTEVETDADGRFQRELTIPGHLPAGLYELQAIGDETLTVPLGILEAEAAMSPAPSATPALNPGGAVNAPPGRVATEPPVDPTKVIVPRERSPVEWAVILILAALSGVAGGLLVWRAERFRGKQTA